MVFDQILFYLKIISTYSQHKLFNLDFRNEFDPLTFLKRKKLFREINEMGIEKQ